MKYFLSVLGLVLVIEGLPYFAYPDRMKRWMARIPSIPDSTLRGYGLVAVLVGLLLIYFARG